MVSLGSQNDEGCSWLSKSEPNHFFKVILDDTLQAKKLLIPPAFVLEKGKDLSNVAVLKVPNGEEWQVEVLKLNGDAWFLSGWKDFADFYSLGHGDFVVFKDEGNSQFTVIILDRHTCTEIAYPVRITQEPGCNQDPEFQGHGDDEKEENVFIGIKNGFSPNQKKRKNYSSRSCSSSRSKRSMRSGSIVSEASFSQKGTHCEEMSNSKMRSEPPANDKIASKLQGSNVQKSTHCCGMDKNNSKDKDQGKGRPTTDPKGHQVTCKLKRVLTEHNGLKAFERACENPFFVQIMKPTNVLPVCALTIPSAFSNQFCLGTKGDAELCLCGGKSWTAVYRRQNYGSHAQVKLKMGWSLFVQENRLQVGDSCVFEMINSEKITFRVSIFRTAAYQSSSIGQNLATEKKNKRKAGASNIVRQQPSVLRGRNSTPDKQADAGSFEFRKSADCRGITCESDERGNAMQEDLERSERHRVAEAIDSMVPPNPYFVQVLKDYHRYSMVMPRGFVRAAGLQWKKCVVIKDMEGRGWPVDICVRKTQNCHVCLGTGLSNFLKANMSVAGDTVVFHYMKTKGEIHAQIHSKGTRLASVELVKSEP